VSPGNDPRSGEGEEREQRTGSAEDSDRDGLSVHSSSKDPTETMIGAGVGDGFLERFKGKRAKREV